MRTGFSIWFTAQSPALRTVPTTCQISLNIFLNEWRKTSWKTSAITQERKKKKTELKQWETDIGSMTNSAKKAIFLLVSIQCYLSLPLMQLKETNNIVNSKLCKKIQVSLLKSYKNVRKLFLVAILKKSQLFNLQSGL